jgi:citrate lyase subunit beta/citryl-CoA lyase
MGTNDLAKELRAQLVPGRAPLLPHLATALLAAREAGIEILDGVYNDVKDRPGSRSRRARVRAGLRRQDAGAPVAGRAGQRRLGPVGG